MKGPRGWCGMDRSGDKNIVARDQRVIEEEGGRQCGMSEDVGFGSKGMGRKRVLSRGGM